MASTAVFQALLYYLNIIQSLLTFYAMLGVPLSWRYFIQQVFVVSDEEDDDPEHVVDYKVGSKPRHRALAAIAEVRGQ